MSKYGQIVKTDVELKPCPFCGGKGVLVLIDHRYYVMCDTCTCRTASGYIGVRYYGDAEAEAVAAWNTRAQTVFGMTLDEVRQMMKRDAERERTCHIVKTLSDSDYVDDWRYRCSECGGFIPVNERDPETGDVISAANYCPNCGARVVEG